LNKNNFQSIGTDKLSIGRQVKMGSCSLDTLPFKQYDVLNKNQTTVVLIRDVLDKWKSGYKQELEEHMKDEINLFKFIARPENLNPFTNPDTVTLVGLEILSKLHDYYTDLSWIYCNHAEFWIWNNNYGRPLWKLSLKPNIYFLDLKDLSNPKFLEWAQKFDDDWKKVIEISHENETPEEFWPQMKLLWKEYNEGKILKGKILASPFFETKLPDFINFNTTFPQTQSKTQTKSKFGAYLKLLESHQSSVEYIRNNHERYLKFDI